MELLWGGAALGGWDALFDNLKVGYDADDDDDLDGSDDVVIDEDFAAASVSPTHDDAGNLTKDADYAYVYDAWNNLVKVRAQNDADVVVGVYAYYADNRRASKTVTNRGDLDGVTYFFYDGLREIEERNGAEQVTQQYVWGHEYLDQLLMIRGAGGTWFVHQDANWNVIALTTPNGDVAEEYQYQPYGLPQVKRHLAFGDSDADGDVDSADNTARTAALSTYNRTFDADFDGDVSNTSGDADQEAWDASYNDPAASTTMVVANRSFSPNGNPFLFTGRRLDAETGLYFYRFRTYHPTLKTFIQRDPLGYGASGPSLYQYVGGMPIGMVDPLGAKACPGGEDKDGKGNGKDKSSGGNGSSLVPPNPKPTKGIIVGVYDPDNPGGQYAGTPEFKRAAEQVGDVAIPARSLEEVIGRLKELKESGKDISEVYIFDHGNSEAGQQLGDEHLGECDALDLEELGKMLDENGRVILGGCDVAGGKVFQDYANWIGRTVVGSSGSVSYGRFRYWPWHAFYANRGWKEIPGGSIDEEERKYLEWREEHGCK